MAGSLDCSRKLLLLHLLGRSSGRRLEGDEPLLLSGVGRLHGGRRGVLDVLLLVGAREARRTFTREGVTNERGH